MRTLCYPPTTFLFLWLQSKLDFGVGGRHTNNHILSNNTQWARNPSDSATDLEQIQVIIKAATKKMIMHAFKDYHFLELQDDNVSLKPSMTTKATLVHSRQY